MKDLLAGSDSEGEQKISVNESYAQRYNVWREKELLQKLKDRYGEDVTDEDSSSSEEEDENAKELTKDVEKDFFKTLSCLKQKDPRIYDSNVAFFETKESTEFQESLSSKKQKKGKPFLLRDYERKIITEREGKLSDDDEDIIAVKKNHIRPESPTIAAEQKALKESFKNLLQDSDEEEEAWGGIFQQRKKTKEELEREEEDYREWLKGQKQELQDKAVESDLKYLHDYWNDPKLESNEAFLRDYLLNKRFLEEDDTDHLPTYNEIVHDSDESFSADEKTLEKQEEFEHKYNFRYEEPDKEFIKRYPRTMENSLRRKDDRRKRKREEIKQRKEAEKAAKREEIKQLKALKRKEILEKIEKLKLVTGNNELAFKDEDLEGDFDPDQYDKRMHQLFSDDYYADEVDEKKPEFPELDEELEIENWEKWEPDFTKNSSNDHEPHCEDPDFNMDCEYNPQADLQSELIESTKKRRKRRRQSKFAEIVSKPKPVFNPDDQTFQEYLDEYYKLDFEDIIGDLPCRFKYRKVVPNSYGLTVDEILRADDKELNRWCSLKKAVQYRPQEVEKYDVIAYKRKGQNEALKRKILTSLYTDENDEEELDVKSPKKKKKKKKLHNTDISDTAERKDDQHSTVENDSLSYEDIPLSKGNLASAENHSPISETCSDCSKRDKRKRKKRKENLQTQHHNSESFDSSVPVSNIDNNSVSVKRKKNMKVFAKKHQNTRSGQKKNQVANKFGHKNGLDISDARLKAYGINPKKFKNKMKYPKSKLP